MDWMNNLFIVLLLTTMTGSIFYLVGLVFAWLCVKKDARVLRLQMRMTQWAFIIPFVYGVLYLRMRMRVPFMRNSINLFYQTSTTIRICIILGRAWGILFVLLLSYKLYRRFLWTRKCMGNIPEEDAETKRQFEEICAQLGISGEVELCRNDSVEMPCITYCRGYTVILPLRRYTKEETAVILYHELCHYLNGDIRLKTVSCIVALLHVINPIVHVMLSQLSLACEEECDRLACLNGAGKFNKKEYFAAIGGVIAGVGRRERYNLLTLADTLRDYERRVQYMKEHRVNGGFKKGTAVLLSACFLMGSSITALAAGNGVTEAYKALADVTDERETDSMTGEGTLSDEEVLEELARMYDLDPEHVVMMGEEGIEAIGDTIVIEWRNIKPGETFMSSGFNQEIGDKVTITTVGSPSDVKFQMGIKDPNQLMRYVEGSGSSAHVFSISIKGRYYFFVTNEDSSRNLSVTTSIIR